MPESTTVNPSAPQAPAGSPAGPGDIIDRLIRFDGPPDRFLLELLAVQCQVGGATAGAFVTANNQKQIEVIAVYPAVPATKDAEGKPQKTLPEWMARSIQAVPGVIQIKQPAAVVVQSSDGIYEPSASRSVVVIPIRSTSLPSAAAMYLLQTADTTAVARAKQPLSMTSALLALYEMRLTLQQRQADLGRLGTVVEVLASFNAQQRMRGASMALCNELATRFNSERVSVGLLKGRYIKLMAMSHTEKILRKMRIVQELEATMEECLDQDAEIVFPPPEGASYVSRSAEHLSDRYGPMALLSMPLRVGSDKAGVLTFERPNDRPFTLPECQSLRLIGDLATARLMELAEHDRWIGVRVAHSIKDGASMLVGKEHAWAKLAAIGIFLLVMFLTFAKGTFRIDAPFVIEPVNKRVVPAPYDGFLAVVNVEPNDSVVGKQTVMAELDTTQLRDELVNAQKEQLTYEGKADLALREGKTGEYKIAQAQAEGAAANIRLLEHHIAQAKITAPIDGKVLKGDLESRIGAPVKTGEVLFEVAPEQQRAVLAVAEDDIALIKENDRGDLATAADPGRYIPFTVEHISPVAEVVDTRNVFHVRVRLDQPDETLRYGTKGVAKIALGKRLYSWMWTRKAIAWVRMKLWI
ncbi:MAG: HlyD family efflux transporter periplasmic adaptor subunit [Phycisphaera sp.]|nr:HlyD family efflux transporter periplasmic adaptor subunit [Phycisphaera sp.]